MNYNGGKWLNACVHSLTEQSHENFECFIIDNGSTDGSFEALPQLDTRFVLMPQGENTGFAKGNNIAAKKARGKWLALLNPDAFARPDWLEKLLKATTYRSDITMVGSTQYLADDPNHYDGVGDFYHIFGLAWRAAHKKKAHVKYPPMPAFGPCGAGALYHRETFIALGGFDERFFCYHEDVDMAFRLRLMGGECIQSPDAVIDHVASGISGRASAFALYYGTRNRIWTYFKNMPTPLLLLTLPAHLAVNLAYILWSCLRPKRLPPVIRGVVHGFAGLSNIWESRQKIQNTRHVSLMDLARNFAYNPFKVLSRGVPRLSFPPQNDKKNS